MWLSSRRMILWSETKRGSKGRRNKYALAGLLLQPVAGLTVAALVSSAAATECNQSGGEPHAIIRAADATVMVLDDGREVRLAGLIAPPPPVAVPMAGATWAPEQAARAALANLAATARADVLIEPSSRDRHGRPAAQVYITTRDGARIWLQRALVEQGLAIVSARNGGALACQEILLAAEETARRTSTGVWANPVYRTHKASDVFALMRLRSSFALVEGTVVSVTTRAGRLFLNFGSDWKTDFTAAVPQVLLKAAPGAAATLQALEGHTVRVRGWIERRYGPSIEISGLADIEDLNPRAIAPSPPVPTP